MKTIKADLLNDVVSTYDQTKTTIQGRVHSKVIDGQEVLGPALNKYIDLPLDTVGNIATSVATYISPNGRIFNMSALTGTSSTTGEFLYFISCHEMDQVTGAITYLGMIRAPIGVRATTAHTLRSLKVIDDGITGWRIFVSTAAATLIYGGLVCINNVDRADFSQVTPTIFNFGKTSDAKAAYLLQDPANIGVNQLNVAPAGSVLDKVNSRIYVHNGVAATHQYFVYNTSASMTYDSQAANINSVTSRIEITGHPYLDNDPIQLFNLVGGTGLTDNTLYFVRNRTANDFQVSATSGGAAITITANGTATVGRAFGTVSSAFVHKTGNLPALTGTLLINDSEDLAVPGHTALSGQRCAFFATSAANTGRLYMGRLDELTSGATTWPSLLTVNQLGTLNQITSLTATAVAWSTVLDKAIIYATVGNILIIKPFQDNMIDRVMGGSNNTYFEGVANPVVPVSFIASTAMDVDEGWIVLNSATIGQRGNFVCDLRSDALFDHSFIVTKVIDTPDLTFNSINFMEKLFDYTGILKVQYRTIGFGSISGGWVDIPTVQDISAVASSDQIQFKILFDTLSLDTSIHAQVSELLLSVNSNFEISDNFEYSDDNSDNSSPARIAFRLKRQYSSSVPTLRFRAYDLSDVLVVDHDTVSQSGNFEYSTDNGLSWLPLGIIPNTIGTLVRYSFNTPPGVDIRVSIVEA